MFPIEVWEKPGTVGRVAERMVLIWTVATALSLLLVHVLTGSDAAQYLTLLVFIGVWRRLRQEAAASAPFPPYPDPRPILRPAWQRWGLFYAACLAWGVALAEIEYRLGGGLAFWFFLGFLVPMVVAINRYGVLRARSRRWTGRRLVPGRRDPSAEASRCAPQDEP